MKKKTIIILILLALIFSSIYNLFITKKEFDSLSLDFTEINTGSYAAASYSFGEGDSLMVFISGSGTPSAYTDFSSLSSYFSDYYQVICFDHAGSGLSSTRSSESTIENLTAELSTIIDYYSTDNKVILVAHSLGSLEAIHYAQLYPERVKGIIFLDSGSPEFYASDSELSATILNMANQLLRVSGINRLLFNLHIKLPIYGENVRYNVLQQEYRDLDKIMYLKYTGNPETKEFISHMNENAQAVRDAGKLNNLPILILSSDADDSWQQVQEQLSQWSTNSYTVKLTDSSHYIHWSNQTQVINEMEDFLQKIK